MRNCGEDDFSRRDFSQGQGRSVQYRLLDQVQIVSWIKSRSPKGANTWVNALERNLEQLSESPDSNPRAVEADDLEIDLRQRLFKTRRGNTYRLLFIMRDTTVYVLAIRGTGQDLAGPGELELP